MNEIKIYLEPSPKTINDAEGGINTVVRNHLALYTKYGINVVDRPEDAALHVVHAGMASGFYAHLPVVCHNHGVYWTGDYDASQWEWEANAHVIETVRQASQVTVPSSWVAETFQRDMRIDPTVLPHGINWWGWKHDYPTDNYVLWNKNRVSDVCDPNPIRELALRAKKRRFLTTYSPPNAPSNVEATGVMPHYQMQETVQRAGVYLATTKETFGVGILEAMASGVPVLGFKWGNVTTLVEHGVNGYLANPYDYDDLHRGLEYCFKYRTQLGKNGIILSKQYTWDHTMEVIRQVYEKALVVQPPTISVVIPCYNYGDKLPRAVESVLNQTLPPQEIIVVDNNSTKPFDLIRHQSKEKLEKGIVMSNVHVRLVNEPEQGVAYARNRGVGETNSKYLCCLDADDEIAPDFLKACVNALEADRTLGVAYTRLHWINDKDSSSGVSDWPGEYDFDRFLRKQNQVPTCSVFKREAFDRLGGFRQRYAPDGAGAEDAELYLRMGAHGYRGQLASTDPLFIYHVGEGYVSGNSGYVEEDWLKWHPWVLDRQHPFISVATPQNFSHPVRQYDTPQVSVIIPVGKTHEKYLVDALDSLEAQTLRQWEAVVVYDGHKPSQELLQAYPYIKLVQYNRKKGAGFARNRGVKQARADLLLFLDADDWLEPQALDRMMTEYRQTKQIVYTDYIGHAIVDRAEAEKLYTANKLLLYRRKKQEAQIIHQSSDFDCERAMRQPLIEDNGQFYIWNVVTSLVPKAWHEKIGGFDESMDSWEDWDYYLRHARYGHCFHRVPELLMDYRFTTGSRREIGKTKAKALVDHMVEKYRRLNYMAGCRGCTGSGGGVVSVPPPPNPTMNARNMNVGFVAGTSGDSMVLVQLIDGNTSDHPISVQGTSYGYRSHGDQFYVTSEHAAMYPGRFLILKQVDQEMGQLQVAEPVAVVTDTAPPPALEDDAPDPVVEEVFQDPVIPFRQLTGISAVLKEKLYQHFGTIDELAKASVDNVVEIPGFGETRAKQIIAQAANLYGGS